MTTAIQGETTEHNLTLNVCVIHRDSYCIVLIDHDMKQVEISQERSVVTYYNVTC